MRLADPAVMAPVPPAPADRRTLAEEVLVVLALSLLASAAYAILIAVGAAEGRGRGGRRPERAVR